MQPSTSRPLRRPSSLRRARPLRTVAATVVPATLLTLAGCSDRDTTGPPSPPPPPPGELVVNEEVVPNPGGHAPLTARIDVETSVPVTVRLRVAGRHGPDSDVVHEFAEAATEHRIPVLGLYADHENTVGLTFSDETGRELETRSYGVETPPLSSHLPAVTIDVATPDMAPGMTLVSYYGHDGDPSPNRPFIFDAHGDIRWYLDYGGHPQLGDLAYDDGVERLANGNLYFGAQQGDRIYEVDMLGEVLDTWEMPGFGFHHEVYETPDGDFLVTVHRDGIGTIEDHIIEIDRASKEITNVWDLRQSLDRHRTTWTTNSTDWIHVNAVTLDERDGAILISGRTQGVVKLTRDNEVVWILAPHRGWETAGDGTDLSGLLLQPLDAAGLPITDPAVLEGDANHPDFEWNWYQHAPLVMPSGNLLLFDNGDNRNYTGAERYSRAVEYEIDEEAMTVRQAWSYGKARGEETFARIVSDVDYRPEEGHVFFSPGAVDAGAAPYGKVVELDRDGGEVVFEATITPPQPIFIITFHRTERLPLYPD